MHRASLTAAAVLLLALTGCSAGSSSNADPEPTASVPTIVEPSQTPEAVADEPDPLCLTVDQSTVDAIQQGIATATIAHAAAYKSDDFENVYYVAVDLTGDGIAPGQAIATFATNDDPTQPGIDGLTLAVGGMAHEFSDWGHGEDTDFALSPGDHGNAESVACVEAQLEQ